jgi:hypothetical protein
MTVNGLKIISDAMAALGLNYDLGEYNSDTLPEMYFVGEYQEVPPLNETGEQETDFILTGTARGKWLDLEEAKEKIMNYFNKVSGKTVIAEDGSAVAVFYSNSFIIPTGDAKLKRIEIHLTVKEWSVK